MMLYILVWLGSLQQVLCQIAPHMDLQKIDEIMYDNSIYNVLKPTIHITKDHFKDFIQQRDGSEFPGKKLLVDRNGIRHYWHGFEAPRPKSLRKAVMEINDTHQEKGKTTSINNDQSNKLNEDKEVKLNMMPKPEVSKKVKRKPQRKKKIIEHDNVDPIDEKKKLSLRDNEGKTRVKTTFFCPFFGVVTMVSYLD